MSASVAGPQYHNTKAAYILPNDSTEQKRLEVQAESLRAFGGGKVIHAPLSASKIRKALDVGCGTGIVTHEISAMFPDAQVYGVDLTPVPILREKLKNTEYIEGDVFNLANAENADPRFGAASFDYIFSRFLVMGMTDWKKYIDLCVSLTAPGGWIEMHDLDMNMRYLPENTPPAKRDEVLPSSPSLADVQNERKTRNCLWRDTLSDCMELKGLDPSAGMHLPQYFTDAGLEDIYIRRLYYPYGTNDGMTETEKHYAAGSKLIVEKVLPGMLRKVQNDVPGAVSDKEIEDALRDGREYLDSWEGRRGFLWIYVVCGRKPL